MRWRELSRPLDAGCSIAAHTRSHIFLSAARDGPERNERIIGDNLHGAIACPHHAHLPSWEAICIAVCLRCQAKAPSSPLTSPYGTYVIMIGAS